MEFKLVSGEKRNGTFSSVRCWWNIVLPDGSERIFKDVAGAKKIAEKCKYKEDGFGNRKQEIWYKTNVNLKVKVIIMETNSGKISQMLKATIVINKDYPYIKLDSPFGEIFEGNGKVFVNKQLAKKEVFRKEVIRDNTKSRKIILKKGGSNG